MSAAGGPVPLEVRQSWLSDARSHLDAELERVLGDRWRLDGRRRPPRREWVTISDFDVTQPCATRFARPSDDESSPSVTTLVTRALAKLALAEWDGVEPPVRALDRTLATLAEPAWVAEALDELDSAARAAVRASVEAWMADVLSSVRGRSDLRWEVERARVDVPGRSIRLTAACDARLGERLRPTTLLVHSGRVPDEYHDRIVAGFVALVVSFWAQAVPERVRCSTAGTGTTRAVPITPEVLAVAVGRIVDLAAAVAEPETAPLAPGGWCRWCHRLGECEPGQSQLGGST